MKNKHLVQNISLLVIAVLSFTTVVNAAAGTTDFSQKKIVQSGNVFSDLSWMDIDPNVKAHWTINSHPKNDNWLQIHPKSTSDLNSVDYKVIISISKRSKSYVLALTKLLEVFNNQKISALISVININKKENLLDEVMHYAKESNVDLVVSMGSQSEALLHKNYRNGSIPIVTSTNKDPVLLGQIESYTAPRKSNMAYTSLNVPLSIQMQYLELLKPNLKVIGLMYNKNHTAVMGTEVTPTKELLKQQGIDVIDIAVTDSKTAIDTLTIRIPNALKEMQKLDPGLNNSIFWVTSSTAIFSNIETVNKYTERVPVIAGIPNAVATGENSAVIAFGVDRRTNAHQATLYAIDILKGRKKPGNFPVGIVTPPDISINFLVAKKIGLKIPFFYIENATFIYDYTGQVVRDFGENLVIH